MNTQVAALITTCCLVGTALAVPSLDQANGTWTLTRLVDGQEPRSPGKPIPTLTLSGLGGGQDHFDIGGNTGCNAFGGQGTQQGSRVRFGPLRATFRFCEGAVGELERRYLKALAGVRRILPGQAELVLVSGSTRLIFTQEVAVNVTRLHASWRLVHPTGPVAPTLQLDAEGRASGTTGCNNFSGTYSVTGNQLTFSPLGVTRRACLDPAAAKQEQDVLAFLAGVRTFQLSGSLLTLLHSDGSERTFARPVQ